MPRRKSQPKFRFWPGGPRAYPSREYWVAKKKFIGGSYYYIAGCSVVKNGGFEIPEDTYYPADARASQDAYFSLFNDRRAVGRNYTALLPIEVEE